MTNHEQHDIEKKEIRIINEFARMLKAKIHESVYEYWNFGSGGYYLAEDCDDDIDYIAEELKERYQ